MLNSADTKMFFSKLLKEFRFQWPIAAIIFVCTSIIASWLGIYSAIIKIPHMPLIINEIILAGGVALLFSIINMLKKTN